MRPQEASTYCVTCHDRGTHALWTGSQHDQRNVGCITCHSVHDPKGDHQLKAASEMQLCATCHRNVVNKQFRAHHMPVREGSLACSSCHNPHGSQNVRLLKVGTTIDESCTSCHAEKRGPFLWEHAPVANACVTCHDPHGRQQRAAPRRQAAVPLPAVPRHLTTSADGLRRVSPQ
jgi:DmsE family decaheme c-type cytochrome